MIKLYAERPRVAVRGSRTTSGASIRTHRLQQQQPSQLHSHPMTDELVINAAAADRLTRCAAARLLLMLVETSTEEEEPISGSPAVWGGDGHTRAPPPRPAAAAA